MNTRVGKIAQLTKAIREELNQRLENGEQGPELLKWLNSLQKTQGLLTEKFDRCQITKSNLSDWRQGGYREWVKDKAREDRIHRISESGNSLQKAECGDLFENFARMAVAELAADLDELADMEDHDARWQRLRELTRELARLQNGYNRSRWAELAWTKRNDQLPSLAENPPDTQNREPITTESPQENPKVVPNRAKSYGEGQNRYVHIAHCGCICRKCHSEDSPYPYWDAERDSAARKRSELVQRENGETFRLYYWPCDCTCQRCDSKGLPEAPEKARKSVFHMIIRTKCSCKGVCQKCHGPKSEYPMGELLRDEATSEGKNRSITRHADGTSVCLRNCCCECTCEKCKQVGIANFQEERPEGPKNIEEARAL